MVELIKKYKKVITCIIIILIIILIISFTINIIRNIIRNNVDKNTEDGPSIEAEEFVKQWNGKVKEVRDFGDYYIIKNSINKFYLNYAYMYTEDNKDYYYSNVLLDLLPNDYIEKNSISKENIKDKFNEIGESEIYLLNAYEINNYDNNQEVFYVDFLVRNINAIECVENKAIIICNTKDNAFKIYPNDYVINEDLPELIVGEDFNMSFNTDFEVNNNNTYGAGTKSIKDYASEAYNTFRKMMLYAPEKAYELLEDNDFTTYQEFKNYIDKNRMDIFLMTFNDYEISVLEDYEIYTVYDQKGKINITFNTKSLVGHKYSIK